MNIERAKQFVQEMTEVDMTNVNITFYNNTEEERLGYCKGYEVFINKAFCIMDCTIEGTIVHELTHVAQRTGSFLFIEQCKYSECNKQWSNNKWEVEASIMECLYHIDTNELEEIEYVKELFMDSSEWNKYVTSMNTDVQRILMI